MKIKYKKMHKDIGMIVRFFRASLCNGSISTWPLHIVELAGGGFQMYPADFDATLKIADDHGRISRHAHCAREITGRPMSEKNEPVWVAFEQVIAVHSRQVHPIWRGAPASAMRVCFALRSSARSTTWHYEQTELAELTAACIWLCQKPCLH